MRILFYLIPFMIKSLWHSLMTQSGVRVWVFLQFWKLSPWSSTFCFRDWATAFTLTKSSTGIHDVTVIIFRKQPRFLKNQVSLSHQLVLILEQGAKGDFSHVLQQPDRSCIDCSMVSRVVEASISSFKVRGRPSRIFKTVRPRRGLRLDAHGPVCDLICALHRHVHLLDTSSTPSSAPLRSDPQSCHYLFN